jgi:heat shock protein HslJ
MTSRLLWLTWLIVTVMVSHPAPGRGQGKTASWLDEPKPAPWNKPGAPIPAAPKIQDVDRRCRELARPPQLGEDKRVREQGWDLVGAYQGGWQILVVRGSAGYDGMCRPRQYQDFVFVGGVFAGTLSPTAMESRADGALGRVYLQGNNRLTAEYARYTAADPLCCPSRTTSVVFDIRPGTPVLRPISAASSNMIQTSSTPAESTSLEGTSWQLVKFQGSDDTTLVPDDGAKYTIEFAAGGQVNARIDCNRGRGTWKSAGPNRIELGALALTRAACPPGSLHDQIVRQWGNIRSYVIRDGRLFLALIADGGIYELEAVSKTKP